MTRESPRTGFRHQLVRAVARGRHEVRRRTAPGWRWPVGVLLVVFGFLGFLPVLGFWMIPLGIAVMAMDIRPALERRRRKPADDIDPAP